MAGRGATTFQKRQKEQQRKEKREQKLVRRQQKKLEDPQVQSDEDILAEAAAEGSTPGEVPSL